MFRYVPVFLIALTSVLNALNVNKDTRIYDVVIYGGTPAGIAAALAAADAGCQHVALLEPTYQIGGMGSQGGVGMSNQNTARLFGEPGNTLRDWIDLNSKYYNTSKIVPEPDNYIGLQHFWELLKRRPAIEVHLNTSLVESTEAVVKKSTQIIAMYTTSIDLSKHEPMLPIDKEALTKWSAKVFIDASYEGDLMVRAGADWTYGRESRSQYNEPLAGVTGITSGQFPVNVSATWPNGTLLPGVDPASNLAPVGASDRRIMGYSYQICVTSNETNKAPFPSPETGDLQYNPEDFELLRRFYQTMAKAGKKVKSLPFGLIQYRGLPRVKFDACDSGPSTPITTDEANANKGYPNGTWATRHRIAKQHRYYVAGLLHFLITDPSVPENLFKKVQILGLCKDEWPENNHWPPQFYVREAARLVGDRVLTQHGRKNSKHSCRNDSIAIGDWSLDIHIMARTTVFDSSTGQYFAHNEGQTPFNGAYKTMTFELPYYVLLPKREQVSNLLVVNCPSVSHVVYSAVRVEPTLWAMGTASGLAASIVGRMEGIPVQDVPVDLLQKELLKQKAIIHWPKRPSCQ